MKRRITVLVLLAALVLSTSNIPAYAEKAGEWGYEVLQDGTIHITEYRGQAEHVVVPETIDGKRVTSLEKCGNEYTVSVELPKYLNHLGRFDSYEEPIGPVFLGCPNLEYISVAGGNSSFCSVDGILMSKDQTEIVKCPPQKGDIDDSIFRKVQKIAPRAFASCKSLSQIHFSNIKEIGLWAFADCTNLTEVTGLEGITVLRGGAFENCTNLTAITGLEGITVLGGCTFEYCENLTTVTGLEQVTEIGWAAFNGCKNLESIKIPEGCTEIGEYAFCYCKKLDGIEIPESVTKIGERAFAGSGIRWVEFRGQNIQRFEDSLFAGCINLKSIVIPEGVRYIGDMVLCASGIENILLLNTLTSIGERVFFDCENLIDIDIPDSVEMVTDDALWNCKNLRTIHLGKNVLYFYEPIGCPKLEAIEVSEENETFSSVDGVLMSKDGTEILAFPAGKASYYIVPKTVTTIGAEAFSGCHLRGIELRSSIKNIKDPAAFTFYSLSMEDGTSNREMLPVVVRKGSYAETYAKENKLNYAVAPGIRSVSAKKGSATVGWNSFAWADAYQIRYSYQADMSGAKKFKAAADKTSAAIKDLNSGKTCYIQIRAVMEDPDTGAKYYTAWSAKKKVTIP